jgi:hypothetical protein
LTLSSRRPSCSDVLCLGRNPKCSSRSKPRSFTSLRILASRIFSKSLPTVSSRLMVILEEDSVGSFPVSEWIPCERVSMLVKCTAVGGQR